MENYPSNSDKSRTSDQPVQEPRRVERAIDEQVVLKKKTGLGKFKDSIIAQDFGDVWSVILEKTVIPWVKRGIRDAAVNTINMIIYGDMGEPNKNSFGNVSRVSYDGYYISGKSKESKPTNIATNRALFDDIVFGSYGAAQQVLDEMQDSIDTYHNVSVDEMYEIAGVDRTQVSIPFTLRDYGWTTLAGAKIYPSYNPEGYVIKLPPATSIK